MASPPHHRPPRPPPMSMTSMPVSSKPIVPPAVVKPPVLASDILREEVAPIAPAKRAIRVALAAFAATFALVALAARFGPIPLTSNDAFEGSLVIATVAAIASAISLPYAFRALVAAAVGLLPLALGVMRLGPAAAFGIDGPLSAALTVPLITLLPAALVFR